MSQKKTLPEHFINRELSWLEFNARVLEEAQDPTTPLLERVKFLSIFSSNLDEFFMVRVAGLREQAFESQVPQDYNSDGLNALSQLAQLNRHTEKLINDQYACLTNDVLPALADEQIVICKPSKLKDSQYLDTFFDEAIFPTITPMAIDPSHPRPRYHNRSLYLAVSLKRRTGIGPKRMFAVVQIPQVLPRLVPTDESGRSFVFLEDLIASRLPELFGGHEVQTSAPFRITRDSDLDVISQESDDMLKLIEERLKERRQADAVRLEISADAEDDLVQTIVNQEQLRMPFSREASKYSEVYRIPGPIDMTGLMRLHGLPEFDYLRDPPFTPRIATGLRRQGEDLFSAIQRRDILLHHPYDDFAPVVDFVRHASQDPNVMAIKQTLYRTSGDSPIVQALVEAAENGKQVTALVELQARFDEQANVTWSRQLEESGVHVVFGFMDLKTHCKISLVVRKEDDTVRRYVHLGTGNYNPSTARVYTDVGLFSSDEELTADVSALFNFLTGYSQGYEWKKLAIAPMDLHRQTIGLIEEQTERAKAGKPSRIFAKLNSLVDPRVIEALFEASQAGVPIELVVRGICCLRPGIKGVSENISVRSIVDRFLEHSRIYVFGPNDDCKVFLSSADWMPRNFYRRVEVMFPVEQVSLQRVILNELIPAYLKDNVKARRLNSDGSYSRIKPEKNEPLFRSQHVLLGTDAIHNIEAPQRDAMRGVEKEKQKQKPKARSKD